MHPADYLVIALVLGALLVVTARFTRRAGQDTSEFILGGRRLPWWLAGLSVIATGISTNTPLVDGRKIRNDGISGLWFQWQAVITNAISIVWFYRLWRRAGVTTPLEFYAIRYSSRSASVARALDVTAISVFNGIIWTTAGLLSFRKLATVLFGVPETIHLWGQAIPGAWLLVGAAVVVALAFSTLAGVYNIVWTDLFEAVIAVGCATLLFLLVYRQVGWASGLRGRIEELGPEGARLLRMLPEFGPALLVLFFLQPLVSQGQWNPTVQRLLCVKDERAVLVTGYFSQFVNFVLRPWPFLLLGLAGIFVVSVAELLARYPALRAPNGSLIPDYEMVFPELATRFLPPGLLGLLLAGFLISFMGSLASNVHSNAAAFINDLYRPFLRSGRSERHYVQANRAYMVAITLVSVVVSLVADNIFALFVVALTVNNASGFIKALRFFWWRVNGAGELAAVVTGITAVAVFFTPAGNDMVLGLGRVLGQSSNDAYYALRVVLVVSLSTTAGVAATLLTPPEPHEILGSFYRLVRPYGWWGPVAAADPTSRHRDPVGLLWLMTLAGLGFVFGGIFAMIGLLLAFPVLLAGGAVVSVISWVILRRGTDRLYPPTAA